MEVRTTKPGSVGWDIHGGLATELLNAARWHTEQYELNKNVPNTDARYYHTMSAILYGCIEEIANQKNLINITLTALKEAKSVK